MAITRNGLALASLASNRQAVAIAPEVNCRPASAQTKVALTYLRLHPLPALSKAVASERRGIRRAARRRTWVPVPAQMQRPRIAPESTPSPLRRSENFGIFGSLDGLSH